MSTVLHTLAELRAAIDQVNEHFVNVRFGPYAPVATITRLEAHRLIAHLPQNTVTRDELGLGRLYDGFVVIGHS